MIENNKKKKNAKDKKSGPRSNNNKNTTKRSQKPEQSKKRSKKKKGSRKDKPIKRMADEAGPSIADWGKGIIPIQTMPIPNDPDLTTAMKEAKEDFNAYAKHFFL